MKTICGGGASGDIVWVRDVGDGHQSGEDPSGLSPPGGP